jgi:protein gp37
MADQTKNGISWTDKTWNPVVGCSIVSPACTNCYAMAQAARIQRMTGGNTHYAGTTREVNGKPVWTGKLVQAPDHILTAPLRWRRPSRVFVNSMSDLFHDDMPEEWIDTVFAIMARAQHHTFQVLTKRPVRMRRYMSHAGRHHRVWPPPNVWLGVTAEDQAHANERIPDLLVTPAAVRFVSAEPLLGPVSFGGMLRHLDWIIVGGESGRGARPMHPDWVRAIREQCSEAGVAFHFKQWGSWAPNDTGHPITGQSVTGRPGGLFASHTFSDGTLMNRTTTRCAGRGLDGAIHDAFPEPK